MTEATLSTPKNDQELFDAMNKAVSEGDSKEVDRLMTLEIPVETSPDAEPAPDAVNQPAPEAGAKVDEVPADAKKDDEQADQDPTKVAAAPAADPVKTPEAPVLTADQITALQARLHRLESDQGRVNHLQSELARMRKELKKSQKATPAAAPQVSEEQRKFQERIAALRQIDPDTAETLELLNKQVLASQQAAPTKDEPDEDDEEEQFQQELQKNVQIVESVHPDALAIFRHNLWQEWKARIPPEQLAWATSSEPGKVIVALTAFKNDVAKKQQEQQTTAQTQQAQPAQAAAPVDEAVKTEAAKVQAERDRKLQETGSTRNTPIKGQSVVDKDAMFSEMFEKIQKENHLV